MKKHPVRRSRGAILVMTLWVLALLSLLAFAMVARARMGVRGADHVATERRCRELIATLAQLSLARLAYDDNPSLDSFQESWGRGFAADGPEVLDGFSDSTPKDEDLRLAVVPVDECGKINVNEASQGLLAQILREIGASEEIAEAIVDWRDADTLGAFEADPYTACTPPNKPLARIEELLFVHGVTPDLFFGEDANHNGMLDPEEDDGSLYLPADNGDGRLQSGLIDLLTVKGEGTLNINTCGLPVLRAVLDLAAPSSSAETPVQAILERRRGPDGLDGTDDDRPFENAADIEATLGEDLYQACQDSGVEFDVISNAFRIYVRAAIPSQHVEREADLLVLRDEQELRVAEWHDGQ